MKTQKEIKKELSLKYPIFGYNPIGLNDPTLVIELSKLGGVGLINSIGLKREEIDHLTAECEKRLPELLWGLRIDKMSQIKWLDGQRIIPIIILPEKPTRLQLDKLRKISKFVVAEVLFVEEAKKHLDWADFFLVKGNESGGTIGTKASFIQIQEFYETGWPFIIQGGIGVFNISSALIAGALGVVFEGQLYQFPECPLSEEVKQYLASLGENDTFIINESGKESYRIAGKLANKTIREIKKLEVEELDEEKIFKRIDEYETPHEYFGFKSENIKHSFLPLGNDVFFSTYFRKKFKNLQNFLNEILVLVNEQIETAIEQWPFGKNSAFANNIRTTYPLIQGPMANVSDNVEFAVQVAKSGALPFLALGGLLKEETEELFDQVRKSDLINYSYGCGIIGLEAVKQRREEHLRLMEELQPSFALIAAGTVNLAKQVQEKGFRVLLHTPALSMFKDSIKNKIDFQILEGSECGGHIGLLSSFILWESILEYLDENREKISRSLNIVFAGGIADGLSSGMLAVMIAKHLNIINPAIQMGTSYLFTEEIIESSALTRFYQELLLNSYYTQVIGTTVNTRARAAPSPFVEQTVAKEKERLNQNLPIAERKELYEKDNLGALRIAAKAEKWNNYHVPGTGTSQFIKIGEEEQKQKGCFMAGEVIAKKRSIYKIEDLHYDITKIGKEILEKQSTLVSETLKREKEERSRPYVQEKEESLVIDSTNKIAIVGIGSFFPDAPNTEKYWKNIVEKKYCITEVPVERWNPEYYYDENRDSPDKTYTKIGAFIKDFKFKPIQFKIPPKVAEQMDEVQKWALIAAKEALEDAGIPTDGKKRLPIGIIIGNSLGGENQRVTNRRLHLPEIEGKIRNVLSQKLPEEEVEQVVKTFQKNYLSDLPKITEDTMPGELSNVVAGRIASVFNLSGQSMTTDAACASSLAALDAAIKSLLNDDFDTILVGGADRSMDVSSYVKFSKIGALSATGSRPFDAKADGFVMGEGCGFLVLKKLQKAIEDGNKIYAIIDSVGSSSDGKGKGITAPNPIGQKEAIERALEKANISPDEIDLIEAHGTSTVVGDKTEVQVLDEIFSEGKAKRKRKIALGSVKSQIGHLKSAAGIASLIKVALALDKKILPPTVNIQELNPTINWERSNLFVNLEPTPWDKVDNTIRRAGVSSFGFGGTNYHAILEEYIPEAIYIEKGKLHTSKEKKEEGRIAFLYTGQGSQYLGMAKELYETYPIVKETIDEASRLAQPYLDADLREIIFGSPSLTKEENEKRLTQTEFTQPALFVVEIALTRLLKEQGIEPSRVAGHSLGEYSALVTAGVFSFQDGLRAVIERGKAMAEASRNVPGAMAAILASPEKVRDVLEKINEGYITIANYNSLSQTVVSGEEKAIDKAIELFSREQIRAIKLNVSTAFHSIVVKEAEIHMEKVLNSLTYNKPTIPVYSNVTGEQYPNDPDGIKELLINQLCNSVQWVKITKQMYSDGARIFIEVGPKKALYNFTRDILTEKNDIQTFLTLNPKVGERKAFEKTVSEIKGEKKKNILPSLTQKEKIVYKESALTILEKDKEISDLLSKPYFKNYLEENKNLISTVMKQGYEQFIKYRESIEVAEKAKTWNFNFDLIGVTGVGIGLPGKNRTVFSDDNFDLILNGTNLIDSVDKAIKEETLNKNIVRLVKSPDGSATFEAIDDVSKVIQLAAQIGELNFEEFGIDEKLSKALDSTFIMAIGAGLEALKDAGIPLVESRIVTSTGKILKGSWTLPESLQEETGIVFASAFPGYDNLIDEVSKHLVSKFKEKSSSEIEEIFENLVCVVSNPEAKKEISNWFLEKKSLLDEQDEEKYTFSREFLYKVLSMGHSQFAQFIKAKGPNTQVNAACASTTQAIGIAEDWIRTGRCKRVIVVASDNASSPNLLPWIGGGFLAAGGASTKGSAKEAVLPFGKNRHGLVIGAAAAGLVIESKEAYEERGVKPIVDLVGSYMANSAFHGSRLDVKHISQELEKFVSDIETRYKIDRREIANKGIFVSHETYTPARGGSAEAEIQSLQNVFKDDAYSMTIINTKGFIGHAMGAGIEEAVAIKALEKGKIPPIANLEQLDPAFSKFKFSKGENTRYSYALRLAAGFGSQLAFVLFRLNSYQNRFLNPQYGKWLQKIGGSKESLFIDGRVLKLNKIEKFEEKIEQQAIMEKPSQRVIPVTGSSTDVLEEIKGIIADKTGYDTEDIEEDMHLEEDLGIDSIKAAEIMNDISDRWAIPQEKLFEQFDLDTPKKIAHFIAENAGISTQTKTTLSVEEKQSEITATSSISAASNDSIVQKIKELIAKHTGYDTEDLEVTYDLEEDLGIDTVKQAEIFGDVRELFGLSFDETYSLAEYRTIQDIAKAISDSGQPSSIQVKKEQIVPSSSNPELKSESVETPMQSSSNYQIDLSTDEITEEILDIISEITGYDKEDIDVNMDLEEDLGVDSIKIAEILSSLGSKFGLEFEEITEISEIRTTKDIANTVVKLTQTKKIQQSSSQQAVQEKQVELVMDIDEKVVIRTVTPILKELSKDQHKVIELSKSKILLIDLEANSAKYVYSLLEGKGAEIEIIRITSQETEVPKEKEYNLIILLLPRKHDLKRDLQYFNKLFTTLQGLEYTSDVHIIAYSEEDFIKGDEVNPLSGGITGLIKTLGFEFELDVKHIYSLKPENLLSEIEFGDKEPEVFYSEEKRYALSHTNLLDLIKQKEETTFTEDDLILVTGGARGITYECLKELTREVKPSIAIIGRTELPDDVSELLFLSEKEILAKKEKIKENLMKEHEKVTPVMIERAWKKFLNTVEIAKNMLVLIENEVDANYYSADVTDEEELKEVLKQIEEDFEKPITAVIHGAGIEESKAFKKKKIKMAQKIVDVKVLGLHNIITNIEISNIKKLICFSSIAGRFGNRGQVDYSFANGYISRACNMLKKKGVNALAIDWSAWADVGMVTQGSILNVLKAAGITPIPLNEGTHIFKNLTLHNLEQSEVIVAGKLGLLLREPETIKGRERKESATMKIGNYPMIDKLEGSENKFIATKYLSFENDLYMRDHQIQGVPIFPAVMGLELFAELYEVSIKKTVRAITEVSFKQAIKQFKNKNVELKTYFDITKERMKLNTLFTDVTGEQKEKEHFFCGQIKNTNTYGAEQKKIIKRTIALLSKDIIYQLFFHGPSFQVLETLNEIKGNTISTTVRIPDHPLFKEEKKTVLTPRAIEAALQTAGLHDMFINKVISLPSKIKNLELIKDGKAAFVEAEFLRIEERHSFYNVRIYDEEGNLLTIIDELGMIHTSMPIKLDEQGKKLFEMVKAYHKIRTEVDDEKVAILPINKVVEEYRKRKEDVEEKLVAYEKTRFAKISNERRKMEYLAGVILAKELYSMFEPLNDFKEIEIKKKSKGQPYFFNRVLKKETEWYVSISHSHDFAIVSIEKKPVGIDIEKVEERNNNFYKEVFTNNELSTIANDHMLGTKFWTAKESFTKALGEGLNLNLKEIEFSYTDGIFKLKKLPQNVRINSQQTSFDSFETTGYVVSKCIIK